MAQLGRAIRADATFGRSRRTYIPAKIEGLGPPPGPDLQSLPRMMKTMSSLQPTASPMPRI